MKIKTALIGCGAISPIYCHNLCQMDIFDFVGVSDIIPERAEARAKEYGIRAMTNREIFNDPEIELVINTTYPLSHYDVAKQALEAGKHVYTEKLICETMEQVNELYALAQTKRLFFGGAPDTFLGGAMQTARSLVDSGMIGKPTMLEIFLSRSYHHERYYTGNEKRFAFCRHGGIIFDMGGYYLSAAIFLLGGIDRICGFYDTVNPDRVYQNPSSPLFGQPLTVESPNNITGSLHFASGALGQITTTSEGGVERNQFVIHGTDGMIDLGDPNNYEDHITLYTKNGKESVIYSNWAFCGDNFRVLGAADAAYAIKAGRKPRCSGELCRHVLEVTLGIVKSCNDEKIYHMTTSAERPEPLPLGYFENPELSLKIK